MKKLKESEDFYCPKCGEPCYYGDEVCPSCGLDFSTEIGPWSELEESRSLKESAALENYPEATLLVEGVISMLRKKDISKAEIKKLFEDRLATFR